MNGRKTTPQTLQIWQEYNDGADPKKIAEGIGLSFCAVRKAISRGRKTGAVEPLDRTRDFKHQLRKRRLSKGSMKEVFGSISKDQQIWLLEQTSEIGCETVAEYLVELVRDAYEEEKNK